MSKAVNLDSDIVYSVPKENRGEDNKENKQYKKRKFEKRPERSSEKEKREETKPSVEVDSDGFEIITEKKQGEKKRPYKKREFNEDGERRRFNKRENGEERPATAIKKAAAPEESKKQVPSTPANKVVVLETVKKYDFYLIIT